MKILGRHLLAEFADCDKSLLDNQELLETCLKEAARKSGATIVNTVFHKYNPQGVSGIVVIAESHLSIHTWPEYGFASVDCFTCGTSVNPWKAISYLEDMLHCNTLSVKELNRGIPSDSDEIIAHKTSKAVA